MASAARLLCLLLLLGAWNTLSRSAHAELAKQEPADPAIAARWHYERGRECFTAGDYKAAAEQFNAACRDLDRGKVDDERLRMLCFRMLTHTYYPHLKKDSAKLAIAPGKAYHRWLALRPISPQVRDHTLYESGIHLARVHIYCQSWDEAEKILRELPLAAAGEPWRPVQELQLLVFNAKVAVGKEDAQRAARYWSEVKSRIVALPEQSKRRLLPVSQVVPFFSVVQELCEDPATDAALVETATEAIGSLCADLEASPVFRESAAQGWEALAKVFLANRDFLRAWPCLCRAMILLQPPQPDGGVRFQRAGSDVVRYARDLGLIAILASRAAQRVSPDALSPPQGARDRAKDRERAVFCLRDSARMLTQTIDVLDRFSARTQATELRSTLAKVLAEQGDYDAAIVEIEKRIAYIKEQQPISQSLLCQERFDLGELHLRRASWRDARETLLLCEAYWQDASTLDPLRLAKTLLYLAIAEDQIGDAHRSVERCMKALKCRETYFADHPDLEFQRLTTLAESQDVLGIAYARKGDFANAIVSHQKAKTLWRMARDAPDASVDEQSKASTGLMWCLFNLATVDRSQGKREEALNDYLSFARLLEGVLGTTTSQLAVPYNALASTCLGIACTVRMGDGRLEDHQQRLEAIARFLEESKLVSPVARSGSSSDWRFVANRYVDFAEAFALGAEEATQDAGEQCRAKHYLAQVAFERAEIAQREAQSVAPLSAMAESYYRQAGDRWGELLKRREANREGMWIGRTCRCLGDVARALGRQEDALHFYQRAVAELQKIGAMPIESYNAKVALARLLNERTDRAGAIDCLERAIDVVEEAAGHTTGAEAYRARFYGQFVDAFDLLMQCRLKSADPNAERSPEACRRALFYAEKTRNRTFGDEIALTMLGRSQLSGRDNGRATLAEQRGLSPLGDAKEEAMSLEARREAWCADRDANRAYRQLLGKNASYEEFCGNVLDELQKEKDRIVLHYYLGTKESYLCVISPTGVRYHDLMIFKGSAERPLTRAIAQTLVSDYLRDYVTVENSGSTRKISPETFPGDSPGPKPPYPEPDQAKWLALGESLLPADVRREMTHAKYQHAIIVPDGILHRLPFQALPIGQETASNKKPKTLKLLIDDAAMPPICYAPSLRVLRHLEDRESMSTRLAAEKVLVVGASGAVPDAVELPESRRECELVADRFPETVLRPLLIDRRAREGLVRLYAPQCRIALFSQHATWENASDNLDASLIMYGGEKLTLPTVYDLNFGGCELAVLSACETNVGPDRALETGNTLARAFLVAGTTRVIASFWAVNDESTCQLMLPFFKEVADCMKNDTEIDYAKALRDAMRRFRAEHPGKSPYYWAPFTLVGPPTVTRRSLPTPAPVHAEDNRFAIVPSLGGLRPGVVPIRTDDDLAARR